MKLPVLSSSEVERVLRRAGFEPAPKRGKGSHKAFVKQTEDRKIFSNSSAKESYSSGNASCHY